MHRRYTTMDAFHPRIETRNPLDIDRIIQPLSIQVKLLVSKITALLNLPKEQIDQIQNYQLEAQKTIEKGAYHLMRFALDFSLSGDEPVKITYGQEASIKTPLQTHINELKDHFRKKRSDSLKRILKAVTLAYNSTNNDVSEEDEGFSDDDAVSRVLAKKKKDYSIKIIAPPLNNNPETKLLIQQLKEKEDTILKLQDKLLFRESNLNDFTTSYLKELQVMREQVYLKENSTDEDSFQFFEVTYFDQTQILDLGMRDMMNKKIQTVREQYEKYASSMIARLMNLKQELNQIKSLQPADFSQLSAKQFLERAFRLEDNKYQFWKNVQDLKGNAYLIDVIQNQKSGLGINYREINKLLLEVKAEQYEYLQVKKDLEDQFAKVCVKVNFDIELYRNDKKNLIIQLEEEKINQQNTLKEVKEMNEFIIGQEAKRLENQCISLALQIFLDQILFEEEIKRIGERKNNISESLLTKFYIRIWSLASQLLSKKQVNSKEILNSLTMVLYDLQKKTSFSEQLQILYQERLVEIAELRLENENLRYEQSYLRSDQNRLSFELKDLEETFIRLKSENKLLAIKLQLYESNFHSLIILIDQKLKNIGMPVAINLLKDKTEIQKEFFSKIKNLASDKAMAVGQQVDFFQRLQVIIDGSVQLRSLQSTKQTQTELAGLENALVYKYQLSAEIQRKIQQSYYLDQNFYKVHDIPDRLDQKIPIVQIVQKNPLSLKKSLKLTEGNLKTIDLSENLKQTRKTDQSPLKQNTNQFNTDSNILLNQIKVESSKEEKIVKLKYKEAQTQTSNNFATIENDLLKSQIEGHKLFDFQENENSGLPNSRYEQIANQEQSNVFNRLFGDSKNKNARMSVLRQYVGKLEERQWDEVLQLLQNQTGNVRLADLGDCMETINKNEILTMANINLPQQEPRPISSTKIGRPSPFFNSARRYYSRQQSRNNSIPTQQANSVKQTISLLQEISVFNELDAQRYVQSKMYSNEAREKFQRHIKRIKKMKPLNQLTIETKFHKVQPYPKSVFLDVPILKILHQ